MTLTCADDAVSRLTSLLSQTGPKGEAMKKILAELKSTRCPTCVVGSGGASVGYLVRLHPVVESSNLSRF